MPRKLPPLNAVRAFEAAGRYVSFTKAAAELNVTHGAVSRQVALLEEWLGTSLFQRVPPQLSLTANGSGVAVFPIVSVGTFRVDATDQVSGRGGSVSGEITSDQQQVTKDITISSFGSASTTALLAPVPPPVTIARTRGLISASRAFRSPALNSRCT